MLLIDLPMPEACDVCPFNYDFCWCNAFKDDEFDQYSDDWNDHVCDRRCRPDYCPLKEQEAKKVLQIRNVAYRTIGYCPSCGRGLDSYHDGNSGDHITHFCYNCGQAVKWE